VDETILIPTALPPDPQHAAAPTLSPHGEPGPGEPPWPSSIVVVVDPGTLKAHPLSAEIFGPVDDVAQEAFDRDVAEHGVDKPLIVTGDGCKSSRGTVLSGNRRCAAAVKAERPVPVIYRDGLSADDEEILVIRGNLSDVHARKLTDEQKHCAESKLGEILGRRQGERTDLAKGKNTGHETWTPSRPGARAPKTSEMIAQATGESRNGVEDRKKVFESPIATEPLKRAVNENKVSLTAAAALVRATEKESGKKKLDQPDVLEKAKAKVDASVAVLLETPKKSGRSKGAGSQDKPASATPSKAGPRLPIFADVEELEGAASLIRDAAAVLSGVARYWGEDPTPDVVAVRRKVDDVVLKLADIEATLQGQIIPRKLCVRCQGSECGVCGGAGWLPKLPTAAPTLVATTSDSKKTVPAKAKGTKTRAVGARKKKKGRKRG